ncbi:penicillin-insensitive murein endopeptidase [Microbulbifer sp. HZ11]|uniref:penicillin-insensitive murein endopeptidase n=1 Tax=Microbulbifer sp. HZ11 TaxID=1453501 RepID=UPI0005B9FDD5|nr:penicillin-insensitive murein endopeptidase [Microbulbifer sp. HZ11]
MDIRRILLVLPLFAPITTLAETSTCFGTTANGRLENGVNLPASGENYVSYSSLGRLAGRTYVHSEVKGIIVSAYKDLETEQPNKVFKYAETGFKEGGKFKPHKTHRNGLSVDFMTPVIDPSGKSVHLPTNPLNKLGYDIEFDEHDQFGELKIDYEAMAAHIVSLHKQAKVRGHELWRVIFDPKLQVNLFKTKYADYLKENITFSRKRSWVRHDEHYHVDFSIPCK